MSVENPWLLGVLQRFMESRPLCVMTRCIMGYVLSPKVDEVFQQCRQRQYESQLKFSVLAASIGDVAMGFCANFNQAYETHHKELNVSCPAFYGKLNRIESSTSEGIVDFAAQKSRELLDEIGAGEWVVLKGYKCSTIDGNHLSKTEKRIGELRGLCAAPLPGSVVAKFNLHNQLFERAYLLPDAHAQESSVLDRVVADLEDRELLIADRHFCIVKFMLDVADRGSCFLIRQHGRLKHGLLGKRRQIGRIKAGMVYEQAMQISDGERTRTIRRITLELDQPTRDGDMQIHLLSNVPHEDATACELAELYHQRWEIENAFYVLTMTLTCEIKSIGNPHTALFLFCLAMLAYNCRQVLLAVLWKVHNQSDVEALSHYKLANAIAKPMDGFLAAIPESDWNQLVPQTAKDCAAFLFDVVKHTSLKPYRKSVRGPKKPPPIRKRCKSGSHVSTHRLLENRK